MRVEVLRVPSRSAEGMRRLLLEQGLLRRGVRVVREGDAVLLPLQEGATPPADLPEGCSVVSREVVERANRPGYRSFLDRDAFTADAWAALPTAYDRIGGIIVVRIDEAIRSHGPEIGGALLRAHPSAVTVAVDNGVAGPHRIRRLQVVAGTESLRTVHREHRLGFAVDLSAAYFSPRLATERERVAGLVCPGETVLDMFAGVGPFAVLIAKTARPAKVFAVELNPAAADLLEENIRANKASGITVLRGDARTVVPGIGRVDRAILNLPHESSAFLGVAAGAVRQGGTIHYYAIGPDAGELIGAARAELRAAAREATVRATREVRTYSPGQSVFAIDLELT